MSRYKDTSVPILGPNHTKNHTQQPDHHLFDAFWQRYPKKVGKQSALKAWLKLKPDEQLLAKMIAAVDEQKLSAQWRRDGGQFIPHPSTWLNGERWNDEVEAGSSERDEGNTQVADTQAMMKRHRERAAIA